MNDPHTDENLPTDPSASFLARFQKLVTLSPHVVYQKGGEKKIKFSLGDHVFDEETITVHTQIKEVFEKCVGNNEGITFNGGFSAPAINIPLRLVKQLDEAGAQAVVEALMPIATLSKMTEHYCNALIDIMGIADKFGVKRFQYTDRPNRPITYEFPFPHESSLKDLVQPNMARKLNKALGEDLFTSVLMKPNRNWGKVLIKESDMEKLLANPNRGKLASILAGQPSEPKNSHPSIPHRFKNLLLRHEK